MTRTPDEIKKGLELCYEGIDCSECPYVDDCFKNDETPFGVVMPDALVLIQQLQAENAEKDQKIQQFEAQNTELLEKVEQLQAKIEKYEEAANKCCYESRCNAEINQLEALCKRFREENEQLQAERDAAVKDMCVECPCDVCKHNDRTETICSRSKEVDNCFEWRGVTKEE